MSNVNARLLLLLLALGAPALAQTGDSIGVVLMAQGQAEIYDRAGTLRTPARRTQIFAGDTLRTAGNGLIQFRMGDGAQLALQADSEFSFEAYRWDADPATADSAVMRLQLGCFRTISGTIGDSTRDDYRIIADHAVIQINDATHEACIVGDTLFTAVSDGSTRVSNSLGTLNLGLGADYDYSQTRPGSPPEGLLLKPAALR